MRAQTTEEVSSINTTNFQNQLRAYLIRTNDLDGMLYFFKQRPNISLLQVKQEFRDIFRAKATDWYKMENLGGVGDAKMNALFQADTPAKFLQKVEDLDSEVYRFINMY